MQFGGTLPQIQSTCTLKVIRFLTYNSGWTGDRSTPMTYAQQSDDGYHSETFFPHLSFGVLIGYGGVLVGFCSVAPELDGACIP